MNIAQRRTTSILFSQTLLKQIVYLRRCSRTFRRRKETVKHERAAMKPMSLGSNSSNEPNSHTKQPQDRLFILSVVGIDATRFGRNCQLVAFFSASANITGDTSHFDVFKMPGYAGSIAVHGTGSFISGLIDATDALDAEQFPLEMWRDRLHFLIQTAEGYWSRFPTSHIRSIDLNEVSMPTDRSVRGQSVWRKVPSDANKT